MKFTLLTLFPELLRPWTQEALLGKAAEKGLLEFEILNLRDFSGNKHRKVDDSPYGGGAGMVIRVDVVAGAIAFLRARGDTPDEIVLLTPAGERFSQSIAEEFSRKGHLVLICGRYEGFDSRVERLVTRELSIGDFVTMGGEAAAACVLEAVGRLVEGTIGDAESHRQDSFSSGLLDYPEYTRPLEWEGQSVPEVVRGGNHAEIVRWRRDQALERTLERRPDLLKSALLEPMDTQKLLELGVSVDTLERWNAPPPPVPKRRKQKSRPGTPPSSE